MPTQISVILCTYNRCRALPQAMESVAAQVMPRNVEWEVLIVDNNSSDQTRDVVNEFRRNDTRGLFRYYFEPLQGLSNARNGGIRAARGEIVAFTDDDVTLDPLWLQNLTASLRLGKCAGAGGRVLPPKDFVPPPWLTLGGKLDVGGPLAFFDLGDEPGELTKKPPYGANMAFRRTMFEKYGGFRPDLGHCGDGLVGNEDTEFGARLIAGGERLCYEPLSFVYHPVPEERLTPKYLRAWWIAYGRAMFRQHGLRGKYRGIPRQYFSVLLSMVRWLMAADPKTRFYWQTRIWLFMGELAEIYGRSGAKGPRRSPSLAGE